MVSERPPFLWLGEQLALDFLNTEPILRGVRTELLLDFACLVAWCEEAELLSRATARDVAQRWSATVRGAEVLRTAHRLRQELRQAVERRSAGKAPSGANLASLNECLRLEWERVTLVRSSRGDVERQREPLLTNPLALLRPIADAAAELLCDVEPELVRRCHNPDCVLYFHDVSKNHARRWCSMAVCGNRRKVAAHYERKRGVPKSRA